MARVRTNARRYAVSPARTRSARVLAALTAAGVSTSGVGMLPTVELPFYRLGVKTFYDAALAAGFTEVVHSGWPCEAELADVGETLYHENGDAVYRLDDGTIAHVKLNDTWIHVEIASPSRAHGAHALAAFQSQYPALFLSRGDESGVVIPITFWMLGAFGPERRLRRVDGVEWASIGRNYTADVLDGINHLIEDDFVPGADGQLLLWYGPPGTGKTWAIRALADAWSPWAEFHYITDPDAFFVKDAAYMVDVLLHESYEMIDAPTGDLVMADPGDKWRILILEDTGELLSANAKAETGQGLSRLLNVVDGMIGQGLRILVLVTANDEISELHPAVQRPGRCASKLVFGPLSAAEASEWLDETVDEPMTLAELYARKSTGAIAFGVDPDEVGPEGAPGIASGRVGVDGPDELDPLTRAAVEAASAPLPPLPTEPGLTPAEALSAVLQASGDAPECDDASLVAALEAVAASHRTTVEAIAQLATAARPRRDGSAELATLTASALGIIERLADRPAPAPTPAPDVHVHMPEQPVSIHVDGPRVEPTIVLPEQPAPIVNVTTPETHVHVDVPEAPAPTPIVVNVPEQKTAAVHVDVHVPQPQPRVVTVNEDEHGRRTFVARDATDADLADE